MGCKNSTTKENRQDGQASDEVGQFLELAKKEHHPVAELLLQEWSLFVDAQVKKNAGDSAAARAYDARPREIWADTEEKPITHRSVDHVGRMFLEFIKSDLSQRGWGGNFDYKVAGVTKQGFLKANANIDTAASDTAEEVVWEIKIHYYSSGSS